MERPAKLNPARFEDFTPLNLGYFDVVKERNLIIQFDGYTTSVPYTWFESPVRFSINKVEESGSKAYYLLITRLVDAESTSIKIAEYDSHSNAKKAFERFNAEYLGAGKSKITYGYGFLRISKKIAFAWLMMTVLLLGAIIGSTLQKIDPKQTYLEKMGPLPFKAFNRLDDGNS